MFKKGTAVVKIITGAGCKTASLGRVESVRSGLVKLEEDSHLRYVAKTGQEFEPAIMGFNSEIIVLEG